MRVRCSLLSHWWVLPAMVLAAVASGLFVAQLAWHYYSRVGQIPVTGDPFDVDAFLAERISPDENAAGSYRQAIQAAMALVTPEGDEPALLSRTHRTDRLVFLDLAIALTDEDKFLALSEAAYDIAQRASRMPKAMLSDPASVGLWESSVDLSELRQLAAVFEERAEILTGRGDPEAALEHHLTVIRMGRHAGQLGYDMQQLVGTTSEAMAQLGMHRWLADAELSPALLRRAFDEFQSLPSPAPPGVVPKVEYLAARRVLTGSRSEIAALLDRYKPHWRASTPPFKPFAAWEIERARRLLPLLIANHLAAAGLEPWQRPAIIEPQTTPQPDLRLRPSGARIRCSVHAFAGGARLAQWLDKTPLLVQLGPWRGLEPADMALVRRRAMELVLALRAYQAERGSYPDTLDSLKGPYFAELPVDPYSGKPFGYTRATGQEIPSFALYSGDPPYVTRTGQRLIYSVAVDGTDNGGVADWAYHFDKPGDWLFPLPDMEQ